MARAITDGYPSSDLYGKGGRTPAASVNLITVHDGFTLRDLVSYDTKQARPGQTWQLAIDSYDPQRATGDGAAAPSQRAGDRVTVGPRSVCVLRGPRAAA
jgi:hypothetical protein